MKKKWRTEKLRNENAHSDRFNKKKQQKNQSIKSIWNEEEEYGMKKGEFFFQELLKSSNTKDAAVGTNANKTAAAIFKKKKKPRKKNIKKMKLKGTFSRCEMAAGSLCVCV